MTIATNTTEGEIVLGGDLTGSANSPELISTGVIPGTYSPVQRMYIDAKGRVVSVGKLTTAELSALPNTATNSVKGVFTADSSMFGDTCGVLGFLNASSTVKGAFSLGAGLTLSSGFVSTDLSVFPASGSTFGFVKSGTNITNTAGVLSVSTASDSVIGIFSINVIGLSSSSGIVSLNPAAMPPLGGTPGFVTVGSGFNVASGTISLPEATSITKGIASLGAGITVSSGVATIDTAGVLANAPIATGSVFGVVKSGTNITNTAGVLSIPDATTSVKGVLTAGSGMILTAGVMSNYAVRTGSVNSYSLSQAGTVVAQTLSSTYTPNFQTGAHIEDITLSGNLTVQFPSTLAPAGTMVQRQIILRYDAGTPYTVTLSGTYKTNKTMVFTNTASSAIDVLTLLCTETDCYAMLNETFQ